MSVHTCMDIRVCTYMLWGHLHVYMHACMSIFVCGACMLVWESVHAYMLVWKHVYVYTHACLSVLCAWAQAKHFKVTLQHEESMMSGLPRPSQALPTFCSVEGSLHGRTPWRVLQSSLSPPSCPLSAPSGRRARWAGNLGCWFVKNPSLYFAASFSLTQSFLHQSSDTMCWLNVFAKSESREIQDTSMKMPVPCGVPDPAFPSHAESSPCCYTAVFRAQTATAGLPHSL